MKTADDELYLRHILKAAHRILQYTDGMKRTDFDGDFKTQDAVIRQLEIIGEAAKRISAEMRTANPAYHGEGWLACGIF